MKKFFSLLLLVAFALSSQAQLKITTKTFDLESVKLHKGWTLYSGFADVNNQLVLKMGKPKCDMSRDGNVVTTYGLAWDFEELIFDDQLNFKKTNSKSFANTAEAIKYEPVWGTTFGAMNLSFGAGASLYGLTGADLGEVYVVPAAGLTGFSKIARMRVVAEANTVLNKKGTDAVGCNQSPSLKEEGTESVKQQKGQKWMHVKSFPAKKSCISLFQVDGEGYAKNKLNYVLQRFNAGLEVEKSLHLEFAYNNSLQMVEVKQPSGELDYVLLSLSCDKFGPKGSETKPANYAELFYINGSDFSVKMRESLELPYTRWWMREAVVVGSDVVLFGPAGKDKKSYIEMPGAALQMADIKIYKNIINNGKESPNLITVKLSNNKISGVNAYTPEAAKAKTLVIAGGEKKSKGVPVFNYPSTAENANALSVIRKANRSIYQQSDKIIFSYQALPDATPKGAVYGDMTLLVFNAQGELEKCLLAPEDVYSNSNELFHSDGKSMYWLLHDYASLNKELAPSVYQGNKVPNMVATQPRLTVIDLSKLEATPLQAIASKEWGIDARSPILANTDREIVLQAKSTSKKAKDSDLVLVRIAK